MNENLATVGPMKSEAGADGSNVRVRLARATRTLSALTDNMRVTMHRVDR